MKCTHLYSHQATYWDYRLTPLRLLKRVRWTYWWIPYILAWKSSIPSQNTNEQQSSHFQVFLYQLLDTTSGIKSKLTRLTIPQKIQTFAQLRIPPLCGFRSSHEHEWRPHWMATTCRMYRIDLWRGDGTKAYSVTDRLGILLGQRCSSHSRGNRKVVEKNSLYQGDTLR